MRWLGLLTLLIVGTVGLLYADDDKKPDEPVKGFFVHEWGVWRVHDDIEMANADMRAQWDELPAFVYGQTTTRDFPHHFERHSLVTKPVLFFHAPEAMQASVRIDFFRGVPAVWWPATKNPSYHDYGPRKITKPERPVKYLEWRLHLKKMAGQNGSRYELKPVNKSHWMNTLRDVKCDDVYVEVEDRNWGLEREKFVYYDGLLPRVNALSIIVDKERVSLKNQASYTVFDVWVIDNRVAAKPRVGRLPLLDAQDLAEVDLTAMTEPRWDEEAGKALTAQLKDAGLNEDEAASLTTVWSADFFHSAGVTLFYRLPQKKYDHLLPLTVKPRPEKIVRVGLVQQILFDKELADRIAKLVKQLDDDDYHKREAAQQELAKLGPIVLSYLPRVRPTNATPELRRRFEELLEKHDAQRALKN
jgi:hypothetical protein